MLPRDERTRLRLGIRAGADLQRTHGTRLSTQPVAGPAHRDRHRHAALAHRAGGSARRETGKKALYVNGGHTVRCEDMTEEKRAPLLQYLFAHQQRPEFTCRFRWEVGSIAFCDNRCTQHNPINDYHGWRRIMHRVTLAGDRPR
jgi:taurine dioxygenase